MTTDVTVTNGLGIQLRYRVHTADAELARAIAERVCNGIHLVTGHYASRDLLPEGTPPVQYVLLAQERDGGPEVAP